MIRWIDEAPPRKKRVLVRVDFNVPLNKGRILDDFRIRAHLPTIRGLLKNKNTIILLTHIGKPGGKIVPALSARPVARRLSRLLGKKVVLITNPFSNASVNTIRRTPLCSIFLIENVRFWKGEEKNDAVFAKKLSRLGEVFVQDAFGEIHRPYATMIGLPRFLPSYGGPLIKKEISALSPLMHHPKKPFVVIMGGAKISTKLKLIENLAKRADRVLLGGALANTALKIKGFKIGKSPFEQKTMPAVRRIAKNKKLILPTDAIVAESPNSRNISKKTISKIGKNDFILDAGKQTIRLFAKELKSAKTILWNGPLGLIERKEFSNGTAEIAKVLRRIKAYKVVGGGDLVAFLKKRRLLKGINHIATGGGSTMTLISGNKLPAIDALKKAGK
ncbi:MAG: phosphoglycerate kinase [bacterium]|nr:phosphoglycerate kinase [bacterium]